MICLHDIATSGGTYGAVRAIDERVVMTEFDPNDPNVGFDYVYLMKDLYTVAGLVDFKGWLVESYDYDAYGKVTLTRHACFPYCFDYDGDGLAFLGAKNGPNQPQVAPNACSAAPWRPRAWATRAISPAAGSTSATSTTTARAPPSPTTRTTCSCTTIARGRMSRLQGGSCRGIRRGMWMG